jgi:hypothetical protein
MYCLRVPSLPGGGCYHISNLDYAAAVRLYGLAPALVGPS